MSIPLISVIIPTFNRVHYLSEAIDSVLSQDYPRVELIVVDDGSSDNTGEVLDSYGKRLRGIHQPNRGIGAARNTGIAAAAGELVAFLDSDDLFTPGRLAAQWRYFEQHPPLECLQGHMKQFISPELDANFARGIRGLDNAPRPAPLASTTLIRRSALDAIGPWDERLRIGVDMDWYARMCEAGIAYRMVPDILLQRRIHRTNTNLKHADEQLERLHVIKSMLDRRRAAKASNADT